MNQKTSIKDLKIMWKYLKTRKATLILYIILLLVNMIPQIAYGLLWGLTLQALVSKNMELFITMLLLLEGMNIFFSDILYIVRMRLYKTLEITFIKNVTKDLYHKMNCLPSEAFEKMVLDLMRKMGYGTFENAAHTTAVTGDEGIDGIIMEDKLGFDLIYIQAKRWGEDHTVGRPEVQAFVGAIAGKGGKGLFVTTSKFSKQAVEYAKNQHIILLDGEKLTNFMIEHNFGVSTKKVFEIKVIDSDVFNDYKDE